MSKFFTHNARLVVTAEREADVFEAIRDSIARHERLGDDHRKHLQEHPAQGSER